MTFAVIASPFCLLSKSERGILRFELERRETMMLFVSLGEWVCLPLFLLVQ